MSQLVYLICVDSLLKNSPKNMLVRRTTLLHTNSRTSFLHSSRVAEPGAGLTRTLACALSVFIKRGISSVQLSAVNHPSRKLLKTDCVSKYDKTAFSTPPRVIVDVDISPEISQCGRVLTLVRTDGTRTRCNSTWLLLNCHCDGCKQPYSGQKTIDLCATPHPSQIGAAFVKNGVLRLRYATPRHDARIPLLFLDEHATGDDARRRRFRRPEKFIGRGNVPTISYDSLKRDSDIFDWLKIVNEYGLCVVRSAPTTDDAVSRVARLIGPVQRTIYGETFDVRAERRPINVAYSDAKLDFHIDLSYYESPPGLQLLHCLRFSDSVVGGLSIFVDVVEAAEKLRTIHPHHFQALTTLPTNFQKIHFERDYPVLMRFEKPIIQLDESGHVINVTWAPVFEGPLNLRFNDMERYYDAYFAFYELIVSSKTAVQFRLNEGDLVVFNNRRILHGRDSFKVGSADGVSRHLKGCYVNVDEYLSRLLYLATIHQPDFIPVHVLNSCRY